MQLTIISSYFRELAIMSFYLNELNILERSQSPLSMTTYIMSSSSKCDD
jgi:hypothetical protein